MMEDRIASLRDYLRADPDTFQREVAEGCLKAAMAYLDNADVKESDSDEYALCLNMLAGHWYLNRGVSIASGGAQSPILFGVQSFIHQLRTTGENTEGKT